MTLDEFKLLVTKEQLTLDEIAKATAYIEAASISELRSLLGINGINKLIVAIINNSLGAKIAEENISIALSGITKKSGPRKL